MACPDRINLEQEHHNACEGFDAARQRLHDLGSACSRREYFALSRESDLAWQQVLRTRSMLDDHIREHSCLSHDADASE
jgi:hypothetical protein